MNRTLPAVLGLLIAHAVCHAQVNYAAAEQFSPTSNPAGVWSYGYAGSLGAFTLFSMNTTTGDGFCAWARELTFPSNLPCVHKTTLLTKEWTDKGTTVLGDGNSKYAFDSVRDQPQTFYRVVTVP